MQTLSKQSQQFRHAASQNLYTYDVRLERSSHHLLPLTADAVAWCLRSVWLAATMQLTVAEQEQIRKWVGHEKKKGTDVIKLLIKSRKARRLSFVEKSTVYRFIRGKRLSLIHI